MTYLSILRGINVGGRNKIKMADLRGLYEKIGFSNVQTYIQSGNVIFDSPKQSKQKLASQILSEIEKSYGFKISILIREAKDLKQIIEENPFPQAAENEKNRLFVVFLDRVITAEDKELLVIPEKATERVQFGLQEVYLYCPDGYGRTKFNNNFIERKLKTTATTRNWKTTNHLLEMFKAHECPST